MPNVKVVIGANFGDEGKGLMTDYFCSEAIKKKESCVVVLCNGGAQRGHTVVTPDGIRHVFHHFGSGTLVGADTYLSEKYILNPMTFVREYRELEAMGFTPKVYAHPLCMWSTPYDMMINQIIEDSRGDERHGSCGMGIWETILRYRNCTSKQYSLSTFNNLNINKQYEWMVKTRNKCISERLLPIKYTWTDRMDIFYSDNLIRHFLNDIKFMCEHITWTAPDVLCKYDNVIFENGQGLLLDQNRTEYGNNLTPSNTGIKNPHEIINNVLTDASVEVCYVTRTYLTRHGAGKFNGECDKSLINAEMEDKTNVPNAYQGRIRYGLLDIYELIARIDLDIDSIESDNYKISLAVTHINEFKNERLLRLDDIEVKYLSYTETRDIIVR